MPDALSNLLPGDPLPTSVRTWNPLLEMARATPPKDFRTFDWKGWNPVTCKIRLKGGSGSVGQWQPCVFDSPMFTTGSGWESVYSRRPCFDVRSAFDLISTEEKLGLSHRIVVPVEPMSGTKIVDGIVAGVFPGGVQLDGSGTLSDPGFPLTRRVRVAHYPGEPFVGWLGLAPDPFGTQETCCGEVIWYAPGISTTNPVLALIRIPASPIRMTVAKDIYTTKTLTGTDWTDCGPYMPSGLLGRLVEYAPLPGGFNLNRACTFTFRAWGHWTSRGVLGSGTDIATGSGVASKKVYQFAQTSCDIAVRYTPLSGSPQQLRTYTLTNHSQLVIDADTNTATRCIPFYIEYTGYFGLAQAPFRISFAAKPTGGSYHSIHLGASLDLWDEVLHNTFGIGGKTPTLPTP